MTKRDPNALRHLMRFLKVLEAAGDGTAALASDGGGNCRVRYRGRDIAFATSLIESCEREGLILRTGSGIALSPEGLGALRRLQHPDAGYLAQHGDLSSRRIETPQGSRQVTVNEGESPLTRLYARKDRGGSAWLSPAQFAAGERLRSDFERGRLQPRMTADWEKTVSGSTGGAADLSDFAYDARRRVEGALDALEPELAGISLDICCFLKGLEQVERERRWPPRSAKLMLRTALSILAGHYGLEGRADARRRPMLHWGDAGYRPSL